MLIIGDYTAKIGDPTGRDSTRPILSDEAIKAENAQTYLEQAGKILDMSEGKVEIRHNSEWLAQVELCGCAEFDGAGDGAADVTA